MGKATAGSLIPDLSLKSRSLEEEKLQRLLEKEERAVEIGWSCELGQPPPSPGGSKEDRHSAQSSV